MVQHCLYDITVPHACNSNSLVENEAFHLRVGGLSPISRYWLSFAVLETFIIVGHPPPERGAHWRARGGTEGKCSDYSGAGSGARPGGTGACSVRKTGTIFFVSVLHLTSSQQILLQPFQLFPLNSILINPEALSYFFLMCDFWKRMKLLTALQQDKYDIRKHCCASCGSE